MIKVEVKTHDNFSVEFKTSFITEKKPKDANDFKINTWLFIPNSLDINRATYTKENFYRDVKTNLRLITPIYELGEIIDSTKALLPQLHTIMHLMIDEPDNVQKTEAFVYHTKMLHCIVKSALRRHSEYIDQSPNDEVRLQLVNQFITQTLYITTSYRSLWNSLKDSLAQEEAKNCYLYGDNFLGNIVDQHAFIILKRLKQTAIFPDVKLSINNLIEREMEHRKQCGYLMLEKGNKENNSLVILQRNALKKFVESDLFLQIVKKKDGVYVEQFYYSIAAGLAMIFATVISFFATQRLGNFTTDLFIVLIVSYMLKDRIKELARFYFTSKLSKKYYDLKLRLSTRNREIGWVKESFTFMPENRVPELIMNIRNRTPLIEAENQMYDEKIILYRKWVNLSREEIEKYKEYQLAGVNDITRFNLTNYVQKMDNPYIPIYYPDAEEGYWCAEGMRVYPLIFILQCETEHTTYYKKYRFLFNRKGITEINELT